MATCKGGKDGGDSQVKCEVDEEAWLDLMAK